MKPVRILLIITSLFIFANNLSAQEKKTNLTTDEYNDALMTIRYYDRTMYYPGNSEDNPVYVHITISNEGSKTLHFKLADDRMFSVDFIAYTVKNNLLPMTSELIRKRTTNQTVYFRDISLEPGEEYSFVENVKEYLDIADPSIYYLEMRFYPELYKNKSLCISSNRLSLEIRPTPTAASSSFIPVEKKTVAVLQQEDISPDRVVEQTILARQKSLWDQFFLYLDVESLLKRNQAAMRKYNRVSADERNDMLRNFKAELMQERIDKDIVAVPVKYKIDTTNYSQTRGTVKVYQWFKNDTFLEKKRYTYYVQQKDGIWTIYDYVVENLGTE